MEWGCKLRWGHTELGWAKRQNWRIYIDTYLTTSNVATQKCEKHP